jgi:catechol 2,3-dioxygenase-like lactoylglutathione lyase family enzyme
MKYHPTKIAPNFIVPDVVATAKYYSDVLGFTSVRYDGDPPVFARGVGRCSDHVQELSRRESGCF